MNTFFKYIFNQMIIIYNVVLILPNFWICIFLCIVRSYLFLIWTNNMIIYIILLPDL